MKIVGICSGHDVAYGILENGIPIVHNELERFNKKTGVPILLNTSFNDREPIVETPQNALNCFLKTDIDYLYFRDHKILLKKQK